MKKRILALLTILPLLTVLAVGSPAFTQAEEEPRFLIFHLDGIPSSILSEELAAGRLPNIERAFAGGGRITKALSLFPGGTEMIYPRMKQGEDSSQGWPVGWQAYDRERQKVIDRPQVLLEMASTLPPPARYQLLEGFGRGDLTAAVAMQNLPERMRRESVVEFFWFPTDGAGHVSGEASLRKSLHNFDRAFGAVWPRLDRDGLNLILYSDHGMAFSKQELDVSKVVRSVIGDELVFYGYPHVYLRDPAKRAALAARLVERPEIDMAFYRTGPATVAGLYKGGSMTFVEEDDLVRYEWRGDGGDPLGYTGLGCVGTPLDEDEWLSRTADSPLPAVPPSLTKLLHNPYSGDVVIVLNPPHRDKAVLCPQAGHMGLTQADLMVSVLFKGPDLAALENRGSIWLHKLYRAIAALSFARETPSRGQQQLLVGPEELSLSLSPGSRWRGTLTVREHEQTRLLAEYQLVDTYLFRLWAGLGTSSEPGAPSRGVSTVECEIALGRTSVARRTLWTRGRRQHVWRLSYALSSDLSLELNDRHHVGVVFRW